MNFSYTNHQETGEQIKRILAPHPPSSHHLRKAKTTQNSLINETPLKMIRRQKHSDGRINGNPLIVKCETHDIGGLNFDMNALPSLTQKLTNQFGKVEGKRSRQAL
ncbi:hypothetical protein OCU04_012192 [Sclerotinia nivalis]|uniref:Uncharacterized protein n=1 Tax=Sclerotinia nivalis TaxID=352851 RepID=A0A9X0DFV8_9HELO|nr:hypothetical protein OCU04_012192 [Sclerotinia nivalis]